MRVNYSLFDDCADAKLCNIVDMALSFSAMMRLFESGSKDTLRYRLVAEDGRLFRAESVEHYRHMHSDFCIWGTKRLRLAKGKKNGQPIGGGDHASFGQIAKTLDVVSKVVVYYGHYPDCKAAARTSEWLNAAVDTKMMTFLKKTYPQDTGNWPTSLAGVDHVAYASVQNTVRRFIKEECSDRILPVQFDDIYWRALNRTAGK